MTNKTRWIGKQFDIISQKDAKRVIGLTLSLDPQRWVASDPDGIIDPDEGNWVSNNINTDCLASKKRIILMIGCGMANVAVGQSGVAEVPQAASESFVWKCTKIIS